MKHKKLVSLIGILILVLTNASLVFAAAYGEYDWKTPDGRYGIRVSEDRKFYYIDDTVEKRCLVAINVVTKILPSGEQVYDFFCNGESYRVVRGATQGLVGLIAGSLGGGTTASAIASWATGVIYDAVCAYYK